MKMKDASLNISFIAKDKLKIKNIALAYLEDAYQQAIELHSEVKETITQLYEELKTLEQSIDDIGEALVKLDDTGA